ncbi:MAG: hypothetical protein ACRDMJ_18950 [Solirubrobacteraceae bacterium]
MVAIVRRRLRGPRFAAVTPALLAAVAIAGCNSSGSSYGTQTTRAPSGASLPWPAPKLKHPTTIALTQSTPRRLELDPSRDYVLRLPLGHALDVPYGFQIVGGHNVVMVGGTLHIERASGAMELVDQTGTVHIEGVRFTGPHLLEGFDLSESRGATVELERVYVATVHGSRETNHADLIQTWAGPRRLLIDGFVGSTDYQGFFLLPNQHYSGPAPTLFDLRNVYIYDRGGYALWLQTSPHVPVHVSHVVVTPNPTKPQPGEWLWPSPSTASAWRDVTASASVPQRVVTLARASGIRYPGFAAAG